MIVVAGPPGAGKSTWVEKRRRAGDVILDRDRLWAALSGEPSHTKPSGLFPLVDAAFNAVLRKMESARVEESLRTVWVVTGAAKRGERQAYRDRFDAEIMVFEIQPNSCLKRITMGHEKRGTVEAWSPVVHRWWREYEQDPQDKVVRETH